MKTFFKSGNRKLWVYISILLMMAGLWKAGEAISAQLATLPIKTAPKATSTAAQLNQKNFYAVWVKRVAEKVPAVAAETATVDALFMTKNEAKDRSVELVTDPAEPDYGETFKQSANVGGVSHNGIFVNGRFYSTGQSLDELAITGRSGLPVVPVLTFISQERAIFRVGRKDIVILIAEK